MNTLSVEDQHKMMLCDVRRPLLEALHAHHDYHLCMRSSIMSRDQAVTNEEKRKSYIESIRERASELASIDVQNGDKQKIDRQYSLQEDLLDSLEQKCNHVIDELPVEEGIQRLVNSYNTKL